MSSNTIGPPGSRCLFCQRSTAIRKETRRRHRGHQLRSYELTEEYLNSHPEVRAYANHRLGAHEISPPDRVCRPCIQRANGYYIREQERLARTADAVVLYEYELPLEEPVEESEGDSARGDFKDIFEVPVEVKEDFTDEVKYEAQEVIPQDELQGAANKLTIPVPGFSRVSYTVSYCVVAKCNARKGLHRISVAMRSDILRKQSIYIPKGVRVCDEHLNCNDIWREFADHTRARREHFNSMQVADMLRLLQRPI